MEKYIKLLEKFVSIKSVSTDKSFVGEIEDASLFVANFTKLAGLSTKIIKGYDNPIILARTKNNPDFKTILIYGHYDVQPAKKEDGWTADPFMLTKKKEKLYGRGSADNKGQILIHLYTIAKLIAENKLGYNIIFLVEGAEETGSPNLRKFIDKYKTELACDCIVISDGDLETNLTPVLEKSFRGVANIELTLKTAKVDSHSGLYGGKIPNAGEELANIMSKMHGNNREILIPNFYKGVKKIGRDKVGLEPAIEITSLISGYTGEGFRNSIPAKAVAKINIRSAPKQNPDELVKIFKKFVLDQKPKFAKIHFRTEKSSEGAILDLENSFAKKAKKLLENVYKKRVIIKNCGGTLPIVNYFQDILKTPQIMVPLANKDCAMHSALENISVEVIKKGLLFSYQFFAKIPI